MSATTSRTLPLIFTALGAPPLSKINCLVNLSRQESQRPTIPVQQKATLCKEKQYDFA